MRHQQLTIALVVLVAVTLGVVSVASASHLDEGTVWFNDSVTVADGHGYSITCVDPDGLNVWGHYYTYTFYWGQSYYDSNGVLHYGWFNDVRYGAVPGPYRVDGQTSYRVCEPP